MQTAAVMLLVPILFAAISSVWLGVYAWRWRSRSGVIFFARFWVLIVILMTAHLLELISLTLEQKLFWDAVQWMVFALTGITLLEFAVLYAQQEHILPVLLRRVIALPALAFIPVVATSSLHTFMYESPALVYGEHFTILTYPFSPLMTLIALHVMFCVLVTLLLLGAQLHTSSHAGRVQIAYILTSIFIPALMIAVPLSLGWTFMGLRDLTPFGFAVGNLILIIGVLRERLFQITPVPRDLILESLNQIVLVVSSEGYVLDHNQNFAHFVTSEVVIGEPAARVIPFWEALRAQKGKSASDTFQFYGDVLFTFNGQMYTFDIFTSPIRPNDHTVTGMVIVAQDVTAERAMTAAEAERERLSQELETQRLLGEAQAHFIRRIVHEFRTPMSIIRLNHDLLIRHSDRLSGEQSHEKLSLINRQIDHIDEMIQQLHDVLLNREAIQVQPVRVHLDKMLTEVMQEVNATHSTDRVIEWMIAPEVQTVRVDAGLLRLWLNNLIDNACRYSPADSTVEVRARAEGSTLVLEVRDYGIGIPEEALPHLFEPFYRAPNAIAQPGMGLGLSLVRDTVRAHGGEIAIGGIDGEAGTRATITLPGAVV